MDCILVTGVPASGKTTLAEFLSTELELPMVSKDKIKELLFDTVGFHSRTEKVALGVGSMEILYYVAGQLLKQGKSLILENNFENASKPGMEALVREYHCHVVTVFLTGDKETLYRRYLEREHSPGRHRGHVVNTQYPEAGNPAFPGIPMTLEQYVNGFESRGMASFSLGDKLVVDTTDFSKVDHAAVAAQVRDLMGGGK